MAEHDTNSRPGISRARLAHIAAWSIDLPAEEADRACAGIVVGIVTLTGLGLKFSSIVISYAGGSLLLTARHRPDLLDAARQAGLLCSADEAVLRAHE